MMVNDKPRIAFFDFAGCEGCQLTAIDSLQTDLDLLEAVEIVQFREAMSERDDNYQIAFVEGSYTRPADESRLEAIRTQAQLVVALGSCAYLGGVNSLRNMQSLENARRYVYGNMWKVFEAGEARPVGDVIQIDAYIPGCPIDQYEFVRAVKALLQGRNPAIPDYPVCVECKLNETACVVLQGQTCLGAVTRAGCGAICPAFQIGCEGCRGFVSNPNLTWLETAHVEHGVDQNELSAKLKLFLSYQMMESDQNGYGKR